MLICCDKNISPVFEMESLLNQFSFNFKQIVTDEIALEGLEGIDIDLLWRRVQKRACNTLSDNIKNRIWTFILNSNHVFFYKLSKPRARQEIHDRFQIIDEGTGHLKDPECFLDGPYEYHPISGEYGSCKDYSTRKLISKKSLNDLTIEDVVSNFGSRFVMVASLQERWRALAPHVPIDVLESLTPVHYCLLEIIGKSRENGQTSVGTTNVTNIVKDPKLLFYNKKHLQRLDLIKSCFLTQFGGGRGHKSILMRLKRFHKPKIMSLPKCGKIHNLFVYLKEKPNNTECADVLTKEKILFPGDMKRINKSLSHFQVEERLVPKEELKYCPKKKRNSDTEILTKFVSIVTEDEDTSDSDDENSSNAESLLKCQYKVGVNIYRQAYEALLESGLKGLSQNELSQILGVEFYTSRTLCKMLKSRNIVREVVEDKGRQRTSRYVAIAATGHVDEKYEKEKQKLMDYLHNRVQVESGSHSKSKPLNNEEVPSKKARLEEKKVDILPEQKRDEIDAVTEVKCIEGLENVKGYSKSFEEKKGPTLRQLKYANGLLKVTREKLVVSGFQTLGNLVAKEISEPKMDTKALKTFVQRLVADGQLKLYKIKWPGILQFTNLICAPHIKATDDVIKAKYKEISIRSLVNRKINESKSASQANPEKPLALYAFPKYMKVRKLHEFLTQLVYFEGPFAGTDLPEGFASLVDIIPELTVELAIGHISAIAMSQIMTLKLTEPLMKMKLKDAPVNVFEVILQSQSLQQCLRANLVILASFGLIQLCNKRAAVTFDHHSGLLKYIFYVNRNAKILDTMGTWPREIDVKSIEKSFYFKTFEDVENYWDTLQEVSLNTIVVGRLKKRIQPQAPIRNQDEVYQHDNGEIFGNGRGPAGVDSCYFLDIERYWQSVGIINFRPKLVKRPRRTREKKVNIMKTIKLEKKKPQRKKKIEKKKSIQVSKISTTGNKRNRKPDWAVKWNSQEDNVIVWCKTAMTIMSPTSQPGCLTVRNLVAKDILSINDPKKIASACHRRALALELNASLTHDRECLINEIRRRKPIMAKYEGILKKIRLASALNMNKYIANARIPAMELVWIISQIAKSKSFNARIPCVAVNLNDFHTKYTIAVSTANKPFNLYKTSPDNIDNIAALKEGIVMAMAMKINSELNMESSQRVLEVLQQYSEPILRTAVEQLRKCGVIVVKEKSINNILTRLSFRDVVQTTSSYKATMSTFKISAVYLRRATNKRMVALFDSLNEKLNGEITETAIGDPAMNCLLFEMLSNNDLDLNIAMRATVTGCSGSLLHEIQLNAIDIEAKFKLKPATLAIKLKRKINSFSEVCPKFECQDSFDYLISNSIVHKANKDYPKENLITILLERRDKGATFKELQTLCNMDSTALKNKLELFESNHILKRVGFSENLLILNEFVGPWTINVEGQHIIPTPWLTFNIDINKQLFIDWCVAIINKVYIYPGISVTMLSESCEYLTARSTQDLCVFLKSHGVVDLKVIIGSEQGLFSDDDVIPEIKEYNAYESPESILVFPTSNALTKFAHVRYIYLNNEEEN